MKLPWLAVKKVPKTTAEDKLDKIKAILFPPLSTHIDKNGDKMCIDYSADMNMEAVITDLMDGYNDESSRETLRDVLKRIYEVRNLLEAESNFDLDAKYIIVDNLNQSDIENIKAKE
jgi:hypothetical protein